MSEIKEIKKHNLKDIIEHEYGVSFVKGNKAPCPFHEDSDPSFHVNQKDGEWLWHCFGCDRGGSLIDFIIEREGVDKAKAIDRAKEILGIRKEAKMNRKKEVEVYDYLDKDGSLLFQCVRSEPKAFVFRRPDGNGGWIWDLKGVDKVPYNLPEILEADTVVVVEGEKDAMSVKNNLGFVATTNPMGAGKWSDEYSPFFKGKKVLIIPDNDKSGRNHANEVAKSLMNIAKEVKILELPNLPEKGDVSDWLNNGGNKSEFEQLVDDTIPITKEHLENIITNTHKLTPIKELLSEQSGDEVEWLVDELIPKGSLVMISGQPGHFKTFISLELAIAVSGGRLFLGRKVIHSPVIYIDKENSKKLLSKRVKMLDRSHIANLNFWLRENDPPFLDSRDYFDLANHNPKALIIFDSLRRFHDKDENDSTNMSRVMRQLIDLSNTGATVFVIHHRGKGDLNSYRGSSDILASVDVGLTLSKKKDGENMLSLKLECIKHRYTEDFSISIQAQKKGEVFIFQDVTIIERERLKVEGEKKDHEDYQMLLAELERHRNETGKDPNQQMMINYGKYKGLSKTRILELLKAGEGKYWRINKGIKNQSLYVPISAFQLSGSL